jgi:16S rRNA (cytosine1402-N4)-methyltransferase
MRMDRAGGVSAADIVNEEDAGELAKIFRDFGEEPQAGRIAKAIAAARVKKRFETTLELADFIEHLIGRRGGHHPATRVFQALRMAVNDEMGELEKALEDGISILKPGGRFAVITFESLTDRVVKRFFAAHVGKMVSLQQGGEKWEGALPRAVAVTRKAVKAAEEELNLNPRSRSAKLRVIEVKEN